MAWPDRARSSCATAPSAPRGARGWSTALGPHTAFQITRWVSTRSGLCERESNQIPWASGGSLRRLSPRGAGRSQWSGRQTSADSASSSENTRRSVTFGSAPAALRDRTAWSRSRRRRHRARPLSPTRPRAPKGRRSALSNAAECGGTLVALEIRQAKVEHDQIRSSVPPLRSPLPVRC